MSPTKQHDETEKDTITPDFLREHGISPEEQQHMESSAYSGAADDIAQRQGLLSGDDLKNAEEDDSAATAGTSADQREHDQLFRNDGSAPHEPSSKGARNFVTRHRKKLIGGGVAGGGITGLIVSGFLMLPLQVQNFVENVEDHYSAAVSDATQSMTRSLVRIYIVHKVIPGMIDGKCTSTRVTKSCAKVSTGNTLPSIWARAWRDANIEGTMAEKYGIEIRREGQGGNRFRLITPDIKEGIDLGTFNPNNTQEFDGKLYAVMDRGDVRRALDKSLESETFWKRMFWRFKYGSLMDRKYGVARCLVACNTRDKIDTKVADKKLAWKAFWVDRVVTPRNELTGIAIKCALGGFKCTDTPGDADIYGERSSDFELETRAHMADARTRHADAKMDDLQRQADTFRDKGFSQLMLERVMSETAAKGLLKGMALVGVLDMLVLLNQDAQNIGPAAHKLNYVINSQTAVTMWMMYRTHTDEIKTDKTDLTMMGSVAESLGDKAGTDQDGKGATSTPLYQAIASDTKPVTASLYLGFLSGKASAAPAYPCNDGTTVTSWACPELVLNNTNAFVNGLSAYSSAVSFSTSLVPGLGQFLDLWSAASDGLANKIGDIIGFFLPDNLLQMALDAVRSVPGGQQILDASAELMKSFATWFINVLLDNPIGDSPSGGRNGDMAIVGANVAINDSCNKNLGCVAVDADAAEQYRQAVLYEQHQDFMSQPMYARIFDSSSRYSMVSQMAQSLPIGSGVGQSFFGSLLDPFSMLGNIHLPRAPTASAFDPASLVGGGTPGADIKADKMGVTQYVFPPNHELFKPGTDPEKYWIQHDCENPDQAKNWAENNNNTRINTVTNMPENVQANGCALLRSVMTSNCAIYTTECLTDEELAPGSSDDSDLAGAGSFTAATYNIQSPQFRGNVDERTDIQAEVIMGQSAAGNPQFDIVGTQETRADIYQKLKGKLDGYDSIPVKDDRMTSTQDGAVAIFWNKSKFTKFDEGKYLGISNTSDSITVPWVGLRDGDGNKIYATSIHYATGSRGGSAESIRRSSELTLNWVKTKVSNNSVVIVMGDFNDRLGEAAYCVYTKNALMQHAADMAAGANPNAGCSNNRYGTNHQPIDHIYATPTNGLGATKWKKMADTNLLAKASDHTPAYATFTLPQSDALKPGSVAMKDDYKTECRDYKRPGSTEPDCDGQCVDFVQFRLKKYIDRSKFDFIGAAGKDVVTNLGGMGYKVDGTPAVNSVVSWPAGGVAGSSANDTYGHTAMVSKVNKDGSIVVEEYNATIPARTYGVRTLPASVVKQLKFAHTEVDFK